MTTLFDSVLIVDWSAASVPVRGANSIWWALHRRGEGIVRLENPATRRRAMEDIAACLSDEADAGRRVLAGFDFPFGYPFGVAERIAGRPGWEALWSHLAGLVVEGDGNRSNRFEAAAAMNAGWKGDGPFWGNGLGTDIPGLPRRKPTGWGTTLPPEWRSVERFQRQRPGASPKSVWQLAGAGSVGSQVLTGLPHLERLRREPTLAGRVAVWPFETGLAAPAAPICLAEVYPSLVRPILEPEEIAAIEAGAPAIPDRAQVRTLATVLARLDVEGRLAPLFEGAPDLAAPERDVISREEAWILGAGHDEALRDAREAILKSLSASGESPRRIPAGTGANVAQATGEAALVPARAGHPPAFIALREQPADRSIPLAAATPDAARGTDRDVEATRSEAPVSAAEVLPFPATARPVARALRYERDPVEIYRLSWATVREETTLSHLPEDLHEVAIRMVHACGMTDVPNRLAWSRDVGRAARTALTRGAPILCDAEMVASGIVRPRLPAGNEVICTLSHAAVRTLAARIGNTRSAAAVELWRDRIDGALVVIGNAPTALFHLLELLDAGWPRPAAILGLPVGFVGAAESKAELARDPRGVPFLTLRGRRGGSAMAAAAVNALAAGLEAPR